MNKTLVVLAILAAVLGSSSITPPVANAEPQVYPASVADTVRFNRPQTREWFEEITGFAPPLPTTFQEAVAELDAYWDEEATKNCSLHGCRPHFGGVLIPDQCASIQLQKGSVFWGGYYDPQHLPSGVEALVTEGWVGVYRVTANDTRLSGCAGGRWLSELQYGFVPMVMS